MEKLFYYIIDQATEEIKENVGYDLQEAISDAEKMQGDSHAYGRYQVIDQFGNIHHDTNPGISFKF